MTHREVITPVSLRFMRTKVCDLPNPPWAHLGADAASPAIMQHGHKDQDWKGILGSCGIPRGGDQSCDCSHHLAKKRSEELTSSDLEPSSNELLLDDLPQRAIGACEPREYWVVVGDAMRSIMARRLGDAHRTGQEDPRSLLPHRDSARGRGGRGSLCTNSEL